jgi:hypothetical protein
MKEHWVRNPFLRSRSAAVRLSATVLAILAVVATTAQPATAALTDPDPSQNPCIANSTFSITASRTSVVWGQSVVLSLSVSPAQGCFFNSTTMSIQFIAPPSGMNYLEPFAYTQTLVPPATGHYDLVVVNSAQVYHVASAYVNVTFPTVDNHPFARITPHIPDEAATFQQIVGQDNARVYVQGDVNLDLTGLDFIPVHPNVQIIGERNASHPNGPRLFTTSFPRQLLVVGNADGVRITGLRFDGMEPSDPCDNAGTDDSDAVGVYSSTGIQIDHNEFYGWRGATVNVTDGDDATPQQDRLRPDVAVSGGVWVHDNYIHDNQHPTVCSDWDPFASDGHGGGYGVNDSHGGFSYIQGNVFSDNRHSIAGGGDNGSGYYLTGNLFLNPGVDDKKVITNYNHQIDMHGTDTCGDITTLGHESYNCGQGGLYMEVKNNTVVGYTAAAIQLRGQPANTLHFTPGVPNNYGMYVHDNFFNQCVDCALTQTFDSNGLINGPGNAFVNDGNTQQAVSIGYSNPSSSGPFCDFDGDGTADAFRNSAGTFWYHSSRFGRWEYMATNNVSGSLTFGDRNGDGLCDVSNSSGVVYQMPPLFESFPLNTTVPPLTGMSQAAAVDAISAAALVLDTVTTAPSASPPGTVIGQSRAAWSSAQAGSLVALTVSAGDTVPGRVTVPITAVPTTSDRMDIFAVANDGRAMTNTWLFSSGGWQGWTHISNGYPSAGGSGSPVTAVRRYGEHLDAVTVGGDNHVWWSSSDTRGVWSTWAQVGTLTARPGSTVNIAVRDANNMQLVTTASDGRIMTIGWYAGYGWTSDWYQLAGGVAQSGSTVTVVSRYSNHLDAFAVGGDNHVWSSWWDSSTGAWSTWFQVGTLTCRPGSTVTVVARDLNHLDLFTTGADNRVMSSYWNPWTGWAPDWFAVVGGGAVSPGSIVNAISRYPNHLDVFTIDSQNNVTSAYWDAATGWGGWFTLDKANPGGQVTATSTDLNRIDLFSVGGPRQTAADPVTGNIDTTWWNASTGWSPTWVPVRHS